MIFREEDKSLLDKLYEGRTLYQGELHDHAKTGGTSDGERPLSHWLGAMEPQQMDFAAILDHRQVRHMYQPEWDDSVFIGGTEPGASIYWDEEKTKKVGTLHYNMIFSDPKQLEALLDAFPEYEFTGGVEGHFKYPSFTMERFGELVDKVKALGGFFVLPHPHPGVVSFGTKYGTWDDWGEIREEIAIEGIYISIDSEATPYCYKVWRHLLQKGKRIWVSAGGDLHKCAHEYALTSVYAEEKKSASIISHLRVGDYTAGHVGIQMCIGDTPMGGLCAFDGQRLVVGVGKFHRFVKNPEHQYRLDVWQDESIVYSMPVSCTDPSYYAMDVDAETKYYRVEVFDVTRNLRIAIGNPIWNKAKYVRTTKGA